MKIYKNCQMTLKTLAYYLKEAELRINQIYPQIETAKIQILVDEATAETRDDSVKKFINARNNIAVDNYYKNRGERPDNGQISIDSIRDYDSNPIRYRNGKLVFKRLQNKLQHTLGGLWDNIIRSA